MKSVYDALDPIVNGSLTEKEKGTKYELACVWYLKNDPYWSRRFSRVGTLEESLSWPDCPIHDSQDTGIDLVAQTEVGGYWCAIQCKCYDSKKDLPKGVCDSFFARTAYDEGVDERIVMTSAAGPGKHLADMLDKSGAMFIDTQKMASSNLDWTSFVEGAPAGERVTHDLRPHQLRAVESIVAAFADHDRCKAVMACGTGKTLMSLRLAEGYVGRGAVLFCAPSISLVGQSMREWMAQARVPMTPLVVCSDSKASRLEDSVPDSLACFEYPATTNAETLAASFAACRAANPGGIVAVFSTYQSIDVIHRAQGLGVPEFDLVVCDEAHRTTGAALPGVPAEVASAFMKVHYDENVRAGKRLYMTATPRIYGETAKRRGAEEDYTIASMDDESIYGPTAYQIKFGEAVEQGLLTDYKVVVLTVQEDALGARLMSVDDEGVDALSLDAEDVGKIIGCWKGLADHGQGAPRDATGLGDTFVVDDVDRLDMRARPLRRAVGFCSTIEASKTICEAFNQIVDRYVEDTAGEGPVLDCKLNHVDGSMPSDKRARFISWLGEDVPEGQCRILTNARCLAEGIDVPNLDAVIFFNAKNSTVDVVQAVGRVMRRAQGKELGYIILPIFVPAGMSPEEALDDSKVFANVWSVLQALRSHDERIEARVNELSLLQEARKNKVADDGSHEGWDHGDGLTGEERDGLKAAEIAEGVQLRLSLFPVERWERAVRAQLVKRCGTRVYWDEWADDVARIAQRHIERIGELVRTDAEVSVRFATFLQGLRDSLNPHVSEGDAVEMVAQHMITVPVFDALFGDFEFASSNPVSVAINGFLESLRGRGVEEASDAEVLEDVYASVRRRAACIQSDTARQQLIRDLYERFFKVAFKDTSDKMGVVYTPTEIIDYILRQTDRVLRREFGKGLADDGVHILDPFAGTGAFMAHLIESDLIPADKLRRKYAKELHSNEILLLAYYIMTVNVEQAYHARVGGEYVPFEGAVLTDTFQMTEDGNTLDDEVFTDNSDRVRIQNALPIRVIVGNPPYSVGQKSANDNNQNDSYPTLDARIAATYVAKTDATNKNSLYDSYVRAFRWASDRLGDQGVICYVSNAGWLRGNAFDGFRKSLTQEFDDVFVFDMKGNMRASDWKSEGGQVFGAGSQTPVSITLLVRKKGIEHAGRIHYHDVGIAKTREEKLSAARECAITGQVEWLDIVPDRHGDWLDQRDETSNSFAPIGLEKRKSPLGMFEIWSAGLKTQRDPWAWDFSGQKVFCKMVGLVRRMNGEIEAAYHEGRNIGYDSHKYSWTRRLEDMACKGQLIELTGGVVPGLYAPFCKQWVCFDRMMNEMTYQQPRLFPLAASEGKKAEMTYQQPMLSSSAEEKGGDERTYQQHLLHCLGNVGIYLSVTNRRPFSCIMTDVIPRLDVVEKGQMFPLYWYEESETGTALFDDNDVAADGEQLSLFGNGASHTEKTFTRHDAITGQALDVFRKAYPRAFAGRYKKDGGEELSKEDIFFYVYGILHSIEYRERFAANLMKELPRIPLAEDFRAFSEAGRKLAGLHLNYESVEPWGGIVEDGDSANPGRTEKMTFGKCKKDEEHPDGKDMTVLHVSQNLTLRNIPLEAYDYVVNGRSAIGWLMDRYQVRTDKASGIVNDPNDYSDDPRYIVDLVESVVTVSIETMNIVRSLPPLHELPQPADWPLEWKVG